MAEQWVPKDFADVEALLKERETQFQRLHDAQREDDLWIDAANHPYGQSPILKFFPALTKAAPGYKLKVLPLADQRLGQGTNQIYLGQTPKGSYELPPVTGELTENQKTERERIKRENEQWWQARLDCIDTAPPVSPLLDSVKQLLGLGQCFIRYPIDYASYPEPPDHGRDSDEERDAWDAYEAACSSWDPWAVDSLHPTTVYPDLYGKPVPRDYIEVQEVSEAEMGRCYPSLGLDTTSTGKVKKITYCSAKVWGQWLSDGRPIPTGDGKTSENGFHPTPGGRVWYRMAWSGLGKRDAEGTPESMGIGLIRGLRDTFLTLTATMNQRSIVRGVYGMPQMQVTGEGTVQEKQAAIANWTPGELAAQPLPPGMRLDPIEFPRLPDVVMQDEDAALRALDTLSGQSTLGGAPEDEAAVQQRTRLALIRAPYRFPKQNLEQMWGQAGDDMAMMAKYNIGRDITTRSPKGYSGTLKMANILPGGHFKVDFSPPTDEEVVAELEMEAKRKEMGFGVSNETGMKMYTDIPPDQVPDEMVKRAADQYQETPGFLSLVDMMVQQAAMAEQLIPPPPPAMPPGGPGGPPAGPEGLPPPPESNAVAGPGGVTPPGQVPVGPTAGLNAPPSGVQAPAMPAMFR